MKITPESWKHIHHTFCGVCFQDTDGQYYRIVATTDGTPALNVFNNNYRLIIVPCDNVGMTVPHAPVIKVIDIETIAKIVERIVNGHSIESAGVTTLTTK